MNAWTGTKSEGNGSGSFAQKLCAAMFTPAIEPQGADPFISITSPVRTRLNVLAFAGPMPDKAGCQMQGPGLMIAHAYHSVAARKRAEADQMHKSEAYSFVLRRWLVDGGLFTLSVALSTKHTLLSQHGKIA
jgi:hypothetical protein